MPLKALVLNCGVVSDMGEGDEWPQILEEHPIPPEGNTVPGWQPA